MMKYYLILFFLIDSINSISVDNQNNCSVCQFDEYFNQLNGYGCLKKSVNETICTCPDQKQSTTNQPCRICNRIGICGSQDAKCSEISTVFNLTKDNSHFACFCSSNSFLIGKECPEDTDIDSNATTVFISTTIAVLNTTTASAEITNSTITIFSTVTTTKSNTSTMQPGTKCENQSSSSHLFLEPMLIILLNLVYFVNK